MKIQINPVARISFGLLMLTLSILMVGDWMGLVPHSSKSEMENRKRLSESMAIQFSSLAQAGDSRHIRTMLEAVVTRNKEVLSAALRSAPGGIDIEAGDHRDYWTRDSDDLTSSRDQVVVPIFRGEQRWGSVEVRFESGGTSWLPGWLGDNFLILMTFVTISGYLLYSLFLRRVLRQLDPNRVIPDRVRTAFDSLAEGVLILDEEGNIVLANRSFGGQAAEYGDSLTGKNASDMNWCSDNLDDDDDPDILPWNLVLKSGEELTGEKLTLNRGAEDETSYAVNCTPIHDGNNAVKGVIATFDDLTELEKANEELRDTVTELEVSKSAVDLKSRELEYLATRDPMTDCYNRRAFNEKLLQYFNSARQENTNLISVMIDIDHFKRVNDGYGHGVGDEVIKFLADTVKKYIGEKDFLARYGGEEFCLVLGDSTVEQAVETAETMRVAVSEGDDDRYTSELKITASFGVAALSEDVSDKDDLVNRADKALYYSKENGRNQVTVWSEELLNEIASVTDISSRLAQKVDEAIDSGPAPLGQESPVLVDERIVELERIAQDKARQLDRYETHDSLTDLPMRELFLDRVEQALLAAKRENCVLAVLSLRLNDLARINDTLGFEFAEELLRDAASRLNDILRVSDTVLLVSSGREETAISKLSDGEFGVLLSAAKDDKSITWVVRRILDALQMPFSVKGHTLSISSNLGIGVYPTDGTDAPELLKKASVARYYAEQLQGDNNVEYYSDNINKISRQQLQVEAQLSDALENDEMEVYFQPKISLHTGKLCGLEALVRWQHPTRGLLLPTEFIDIAERTRQINQLGDWVLESSCRHLAALDKHCSLKPSIAVNVSPVQLAQPALAERILGILEETGTDPQRVELELTESVLLQNMDLALDSMAKLRAAGVQISIDDFGTGYSGLSYLKNLPVDSLKIDRSFISDLEEGGGEHAIIAAIINMAQTLNLTVVAEGVETRAQLETLTALSCDQVQGFLFSKPVPAKDIIALLKASGGVPMQLRVPVRGKSQTGLAV